MTFLWAIRNGRLFFYSQKDSIVIIEGKLLELIEKMISEGYLSKRKHRFQVNYGKF